MGRALLRCRSRERVEEEVLMSGVQVTEYESRLGLWVEKND